MAVSALQQWQVESAGFARDVAVGREFDLLAVLEHSCHHATKLAEPKLNAQRYEGSAVRIARPANEREQRVYQSRHVRTCGLRHGAQHLLAQIGKWSDAALQELDQVYEQEVSLEQKPEL